MRSSLKPRPSLVGLLCCLWAGLWLTSQAAAAPLGGDFRLIGPDGRPYSLKDADGSLVVLSFGYTSCPDVCPTTMLTIAQAMEQMGPDATRVQPLFISLDPDRDTPERLQEYARYFHPRIIGLTADARTIAELAERYRVRYRFVDRDSKPDSYAMDHSANIYVLDKQGRVQRMIPHGVPARSIARTLRMLLGLPEDRT